jgi:mannosyltransferase
VVTVHDFAYERWVAGPRAWTHTLQKNAAIRHAQAIICVSEATRDDLLEFVPLRSDQRVHVVYNGVGEAFHPLDNCADPTLRPFALFVGQRGRYKNFSLALKAMELMPDVELFCVGGGPLQQAEVATASHGARARVKHLGTVSDEALNRLYNQAQCLLYPSAYEGFGIPVLEAMRAGCPVVSVSCKAVLEIGGKALTVAAPSPEGLAAAVLSTASAQRAVLRSQGLALSSRYSWDRHCAETLAVYRLLAAA